MKLASVARALEAPGHPVSEDDPPAIPTTVSPATWLPLAAFIAASAALLVAV